MFQSTHSLRSATLPDGCKSHLLAVSIHALLAECDRVQSTMTPLHTLFQSTHSLRSATGIGNRPARFRLFQSTHSLRSATFWHCKCINVPCGFNPRTPCGVRLPIPLVVLFSKCFNPRTPCGVRPRCCAGPPPRRCVSIHALLAECDNSKLSSPGRVNGFQSTHSLRSATPRLRRRQGCPCGFNPRTPCGVRLGRGIANENNRKFQSTHSLRSATL